MDKPTANIIHKTYEPSCIGLNAFETTNLLIQTVGEIAFARDSMLGPLHFNVNLTMSQIQNDLVFAQNKLPFYY